jgi:hypothetical protein
MESITIMFEVDAKSFVITSFIFDYLTQLNFDTFIAFSHSQHIDMGNYQKQRRTLQH